MNRVVNQTIRMNVNGMYVSFMYMGKTEFRVELRDGKHSYFGVLHCKEPDTFQYFSFITSVATICWTKLDWSYCLEVSHLYKINLHRSLSTEEQKVKLLYEHVKLIKYYIELCITIINYESLVDSIVRESDTIAKFKNILCLPWKGQIELTELSMKCYLEFLKGKIITVLFILESTEVLENKKSMCYQNTLELIKINLNRALA